MRSRYRYHFTSKPQSPDGSCSVSLPTVFSKPQFTGFWISNISNNIRCRENSFREWFGFCVIFLRVKNGLLIRSPSTQTEPLFFTASREPPFLLRLTSVSLPSVTSVISQTTSSSAFPWIKMSELRLKFHWSLFLRVHPINNIPALVQIMAWRRPGDKPLSEALVVRLLTHICVARPHCCSENRFVLSIHYDDVIMTTLASQITSLTVVYSIAYSGVDQRKHQSSASLAFVRGIHRDRWIPRTKGQQCGKCFHLMTSWWNPIYMFYRFTWVYFHFPGIYYVNRKIWVYSQAKFNYEIYIPPQQQLLNLNSYCCITLASVPSSRSSYCIWFDHQ